ncbi:MAG: class I SAM-dependent methyltransferase [Vicinamibacteria bacterium]|nr:class I SAM-dependent methyltransferase [Vicinamibacteria bacterium]
MKALALYNDMPARVRLHTRIRAWTCPMKHVVERAPAAGRLLEVGCGHGLFANETALRNPRLAVLGIDPDPGKIRWALASIKGRNNVEFRQTRIEDLADGEFDALAILDVLYLVPRVEWKPFLTRCRAALRDGGRLLLKEVDVRPRWKFYRCVLQEQISVRLLGITLGDSFAFAEREEMRRLLEEVGFTRVTTADLQRGRLTPHVLYEAARA